MEAAHIPWRPLGRLLVEKGLLTEEQLDAALDEQAITGRRLGEILVELNCVTHSALTLALAEQYGFELPAQTGFGTGLRAQIERRQEGERAPDDGTQPQPAAAPAKLALVPEPAAAGADGFVEDPLHLAHLEEQWAKLAAAEAQLAEAERELAELRRRAERRRAQAVRLVGRLRRRDRSGEQARVEGELARRRAQAVRLIGRLRIRDGRIGELTAALADAERELGTARTEGERRRAQAVRLVERLRRRGRRLEELAEAERELERLRGSAERRRAQAVRLVERVRRRDKRLEELAEAERELERLRGSAERRRAQAVRLVERVRARDRRLAELSAPPPQAADGVPDGHLVFAQLAAGYELLEREGAPPEPDVRLALPEIGDARFVVSGIGHSPLPNDPRPCVFVLPLHEPVA